VEMHRFLSSSVSRMTREFLPPRPSSIPTFPRHIPSSTIS
jgi:hypothetical protein